MRELAYIVHQIPGRVRLRLKQKRHDQPYFDALRRQLQHLDVIEDARVNCNTGSILLRHPGQPYSAVEAELRKLALFEVAKWPDESASPAGRPPLSGISTIDERSEEKRVDLLNLRTLVLIVIALLIIREVRRGQLLGLALPMLWNAFELAGRLNGWLSDAVDKKR